MYRALRLLADTAQGGVVQSLAREGGLQSTFWAGPETLARRMKAGNVPIQGAMRKKSMRLKLGFVGDEFGYSISLGLPTPSTSAFSLDPEIKRECIWSGDLCRPATMLVDRVGGVVKTRSGRNWEIVSDSLSNFESMLSQIGDPGKTPDVIQMREVIRGWRFYDHFRTDQNAPAKLPQLGTRTTVLNHDGNDLAAALQTILEIGDAAALQDSIDKAFPGSTVGVEVQSDGRFVVKLKQDGLLRPLTSAELSDGTLRYLLLITALLTPRPPSMMVLNEPETSLHPELLPALADLIIHAAKRSQIWVVSHSQDLITHLKKYQYCSSIELQKEFGQSTIVGQDVMDLPLWYFPE